MSPFRRFTQWFLLAILLAFLLLSLNYRAVLTAVGSYLVETRPPEKADAILVLAGDFRGARILRAAELVQGGFAPIALVSGPTEIYGVNEATLAIRYANSRGMPANYFEAVPIRAFSTLEEAHAFAPELRKRNIRKLLLVTSNYHTHRAAGIFRAVRWQRHSDTQCRGAGSVLSVPSRGGTIGKGRRLCSMSTRRRSPAGWECR